jgi:hypothetical protein
LNVASRNVSDSILATDSDSNVVGTKQAGSVPVGREEANDAADGLSGDDAAWESAWVGTCPSSCPANSVPSSSRVAKGGE